MEYILNETPIRTTNNYETWMTLEKDQCETIFVDPSTYKIKENIILKIDYSLFHNLKLYWNYVLDIKLYHQDILIFF